MKNSQVYMLLFGMFLTGSYLVSGSSKFWGMVITAIAWFILAVVSSKEEEGKIKCQTKNT